jgi:histidine triad (HIT) family protein
MSSMSTIFSKIIAKEIPGFFIYEDDMCVAIMDKYPAVVGQSMVILRREAPYLFDLTDDEYHHLFSVAKRIAKASDAVFAIERSCMVVEGFEVPHVHIKIYPVSNTVMSLGAVIDKQTEAQDSDLAQYAKKIAEQMN